MSKSPRLEAGGFFFRTAMLRNQFPEKCAWKDPTVACPCTGASVAEELKQKTRSFQQSLIRRG